MNRAQSVTFLYRYQNNVIRPLENRVRALEGGSVQTQDSNTGFGNQPTPTTVPPRTFTTRGTQRPHPLVQPPGRLVRPPCSRWRPPRQPRTTIRATTATKAAPPATSPKPVILIQVEYRENSSSAWKTHAVNTLKLESGTLPAAGQALFKEAGPADVEIANVPGRLPTSGQTQGPRLHGRQLRHPRGRCRHRPTTETTKYDFSWGLILTEKRS